MPGRRLRLERAEPCEGEVEDGGAHLDAEAPALGGIVSQEPLETLRLPAKTRP